MTQVCRISLYSFSCVLLVCFTVGCNGRYHLPWRHGGDDAAVDAEPELAVAEAVEEERVDLSDAADVDVADLVEPEAAMADLLQSDPVAAFPGGGKSYSAPVAVSNSLAALSKRGYDRLMAVAGGAKTSQIALVNRLSGAGYMGMGVDSGATVPGILGGVQLHVEESGYGIDVLKHEGLRLYYQPDKKPDSSLVDLEWVATTMAEEGAAVWLNLGWYVYTPESDSYQKKGGHWVTLVGHGIGADGAMDHQLLTVHDPSPRSGAGPSAEHIALTALGSGVIKGYGLPQDAKGYYDVEGIAYPIECNRAILEGVIVLRLQPPGATE